MKTNIPNRPAVMKDTEEALEKFLFYSRARDAARDVLRLICSEYAAGCYHGLDPEQLEFIENDIELLFNELDECDRLLYNRSLRH